MALREELAATLNRHSAESRSDTPDFVLARYLTGCLNAFDVAVNERERYYGREVRCLTKTVTVEIEEAQRPE